MELDIALEFGVFLTYPPVKAADLRNITPVLDAAYE